MKKIAILLDAGFVKTRLYELLGHRFCSATDISSFVRLCVKQDEELFRVYYYDCPPFEESIKSKLNIDIPLNQRLITREKDLQNKLALTDTFAIRRGELSLSGLKLNKHIIETFRKNPEIKMEISSSDLIPDFKQKRVDMKIGLDVAWLSSKRIVDKIVLVTGDSDFVPAMKFARREGVQVVIVPMGSKYIKTDLKEHADEVRDIEFSIAEKEA